MVTMPMSIKAMLRVRQQLLATWLAMLLTPRRGLRQMTILKIRVRSRPFYPSIYGFQS
jgi:hypothetical protein